MKITIKRIPPKDRIFYLIYGFYLFFSYINVSLLGGYIPGIYYGISILTVVALLTLELTNRHSNRMAIGIIVIAITLLMLINYSRGGVAFESLAILIVICMAGRTRDVETLLTFSLFIGACALAIVVLCSQLGIVNDFVSNYYGRVRHYLGFTYCLYPSRIMSSITIGLVYLRGKKFKFVEGIVLFFVNYVFYRLTDSRIAFITSVLIVVIALFINLVLGKRKKRKSIIGTSLEIFFKLFAVLSYCICCAISFIMAIFFDSSNYWQSAINTFLGNRIVFSRQSLLQYGVKWYGQNIAWNGAGLSNYGTASNSIYNWVDNVYIKLFQSYGYVFAIIILVIITLLMHRIAKTDNILMIIILTLIAISCMFEDILMQLYFNPFWFFLTASITKGKGKFDVYKERGMKST